MIAGASWGLGMRRSLATAWSLCLDYSLSISRYVMQNTRGLGSLLVISTCSKRRRGPGFTATAIQRDALGAFAGPVRDLLFSIRSSPWQVSSRHYSGVRKGR